MADEGRMVGTFTVSNDASDQQTSCSKVRKYVLTVVFRSLNVIDCNCRYVCTYVHTLLWLTIN